MRDLIEVRDRATGETLAASGNRKPGDPGKGDSARPLSISREEYERRFDAIDWSK